MSRNSFILAAFAALLVLGTSIRPAMAYFSCYTEAAGAKEILLSDDTEIDEPAVEDWIKHLVVTNTGDSAVFVRAKAFAADRYSLSCGGQNWTGTQEDGYCYYRLPVETGAKADELLVKISGIPEDELLRDGDGFNIAVIYEAVPVRYNEDGSLKAFNDPAEVWNQELIVVSE